MTSPCNKHLFPAAIRFFKIILTTTLAHAELKLPKNFTRKYGEGMSNPVFLKPPDGTEWKVYWTKHDSEVWFQKGWKEFATYYCLDHGHLLFFEYQGTSQFDVHIFGNSHIEVDYPCHDGKDNLLHVEVSDEQFSHQKTKLKSTMSSSQPCKKMKNCITTDVERSPNGVNLHLPDPTRSTSSQEAKFMKQKLYEDKGKDIFQNECPKVEQLPSMLLNKATTLRSKLPSFTHVMKASFINEDYLEIPPQFSEQYLKKTHATVLFEVSDGRSWPVSCSAHRITDGWQKFASENSLNVGDLCVFELIQKIQGLAFKVSIFRGAGEPSSPISQGGNSSQKSSRLESHFKLKIFKSSALEEASKFTSENPFFMATLTLNLQANVARCPRVPTNFVRKYLVDRKKKVAMIQFREKLWPVTFVFSEYQISATLSAGWTSLARENKLQAGDVCIFELVNRENVTLDLHVFGSHTKVMH